MLLISGKKEIFSDKMGPSRAPNGSNLGFIGFDHLLHLLKYHNSYMHWCLGTYTVNFEIFPRVFYFRETSHMRSFVKIKSSRNDKITMSFVNIAKACPSRAFQPNKYVF